jgi:hypothetical protein
VREGARKVGKKRKTILREEQRKKDLEEKLSDRPEELEQELKKTSELRKDPKRHTIQCVAYEVVELMSDLIKFAALHLVIGGRLVFWFPVTRKLYPPFLSFLSSVQPNKPSTPPPLSKLPPTDTRKVTFQFILACD